MFKITQVHLLQQVADSLIDLGSIMPGDAKSDIIIYCQVRKQGIILKYIAYFPLLRRKIKAVLGIVQNPAVNIYIPFIGVHQSGDTLQG